MPSLQFPPTRSRPSLPPVFVIPFPWRHSTCAIATRYIFISVRRKSRKTTCIGLLLRWRPSSSTNTAVAVPYNSNHPIQQKYAAIRFLYDRLNSYHLQGKESRHKKNIMHNILHKNSSPIILQKPNNYHGSQSQNSQNKHKYYTFTYIRKETTYITKIFKHSNIKVAYRTNNTLQNT